MVKPYWPIQKRTRRIGTCRHEETTSTLTAGLERIVCDRCAHVSVQYRESTVKTFPDGSPLPAEDMEPEFYVDLSAPPTRAHTCSFCDASAIYFIPGGLACAEHARVVA